LEDLIDGRADAESVDRFQIRIFSLLKGSYQRGGSESRGAKREGRNPTSNFEKHDLDDEASKNDSTTH
jgi:hypothetical protein